MACETGSPDLNLSDCLLLNNTQTVKSVYDSPGVLLNMFVQYSFIIAGLLLFFYMLYAGFLFISDDVKGKDKANEVITQAVIGFVVMFAAYWIMQLIQFVTGANIAL